MLDMIKPATPGKISLSDLKKCKMTSIFFDTFFNLEKYLDHEQRDPFASAREHDPDGHEVKSSWNYQMQIKWNLPGNTRCYEYLADICYRYVFFCFIRNSCRIGTDSRQRSMNCWSPKRAVTNRMSKCKYWFRATYITHTVRLCHIIDTWIFLLSSINVIKHITHRYY